MVYFLYIGKTQAPSVAVSQPMPGRLCCCHWSPPGAAATALMW